MFKVLLSALLIAFWLGDKVLADTSTEGQVTATLTVRSSGETYIKSKDNDKGEVWYDLLPEMSTRDAQWSLKGEGMNGLLEKYFSFPAVPMPKMKSDEKISGRISFDHDANHVYLVRELHYKNSNHGGVNIEINPRVRAELEPIKDETKPGLEVWRLSDAGAKEFDKNFDNTAEDLKTNAILPRIQKFQSDLPITFDKVLAAQKVADDTDDKPLIRVVHHLSTGQVDVFHASYKIVFPVHAVLNGSDESKKMIQEIVNAPTQSENGGVKQ